MSQKIISVNYEIPGHSNDSVSFNSKASLMDGDILVFKPDTPDGYEEQYQGKSSYDDTGSFHFKESSQHWKNEISGFLNSGKTVFLFLVEKESFFLKTGQKEHKPKMTLNYVDLHNNYEFLSIDIGNITTARGKYIEFTNNTLFADFFKRFSSNFEYQVYLENVGSAQVIFTGKDKTKILGAVYKVDTGHLVVLPSLDYDEEKFIEYKKNKKGESEGFWTKEAIDFGNALISNFVQIDKGLREEAGKTPPPIWITESDYTSKKEDKIANSINVEKKKIADIRTIIEGLEAEIIEERGLKDLLFEQGKPLENTVIKALKLLGYKAENYDDGELELDQVIISPEGHRYIGECEGKNEKDIDITKLRQLIESMNADFSRDEIEEKAFGILFGNPQRLTSPKDRTLDFTKKCRAGAAREKIALVKTVDLFKVAKYIAESNNDEFKKECRDAIHNGLGTVVVFPNISKN